MRELAETKVIDQDLLEELLEICKMDGIQTESRMQSEEDQTIRITYWRNGQ